MIYILDRVKILSQLLIIIKLSESIKFTFYNCMPFSFNSLGKSHLNFLSYVYKNAIELGAINLFFEENPNFIHFLN